MYRIVIIADAVPMTDRHKNIIRCNWSKLCDNLTNITGLCGALLEANIITFNEQEDILKSIDTDADKAHNLLNRLRKKEDRAYYVLIEACEKNAMPHVVNILRKAGMYS